MGSHVDCPSRHDSPTSRIYCEGVGIMGSISKNIMVFVRRNIHPGQQLRRTTRLQYEYMLQRQHRPETLDNKLLTAIEKG